MCSACAIAIGSSCASRSGSTTSIARLREQTWVNRLGLPAASAESFGALGSGRVSTIDSGPRLLALLAVGSYPSPAADGRVWKYCTSGLPSPSGNCGCTCAAIAFGFATGALGNTSAWIVG
jgi:hypothetical protein